MSDEESAPGSMLRKGTASMVVCGGRMLEMVGGRRRQE
jgi:hypothetical protein